MKEKIVTEQNIARFEKELKKSEKTSSVVVEDDTEEGKTE